MRNGSLLLCSLLLSVLFGQLLQSWGGEPKTAGSQTALVLTDRTQPTLAYAAEELTSFLEKLTALEIRRTEEITPDTRVFHLAADTTLPEGAWEVQCRPSTNRAMVVRLAGHGPTEVLHAVYTLLERLGVMFDITGPVLPARVNVSELRRALGSIQQGERPSESRSVQGDALWRFRIEPAVRLRGIRQHINFPMDMSSYPLAEAREYIRNLARLRMNLIIFHSYRGQFYECAPLNIQAGDFFYGQKHPVAETPLFQEHVRNRRMFCIPEIEAIYDNKPERSRATVEWLRDLMRQAKLCGLTVQFSFEPPGDKAEDGLAACQAILASYPQIDILELITPENFGTPEKTVARGLAIADSLKRATGEKCPRLIVGVYETGRALQNGLKYLRQHSPPDIRWSFLPAHGARAVVDAVRNVGFTAADWRRSIVYSWVEFDGLMYCQQNSLVGAKELLLLANRSLGDEPIPAIAFNHWRTAENRTAMRYAAQLCIDASLTPTGFYAAYARALDIGDATLYARAMEELDNLDAFCRDRLFNVGFCYLGCWTNPKGLAWTRGWRQDALRAAAKRFTSVQEILTTCLQNTGSLEGRAYLRFLENRLRCTVIHLEAIEQLAELHSVCDDAHPDKLDSAGRAVVEERCRSAMKLAGEYMNLHAEAIVDRGCEGTLISYYHTIPAYVTHIQDYFLKAGPGGGQKSDGNSPPATSNKPPAPGQSSKP